MTPAKIRKTVVSLLMLFGGVVLFTTLLRAQERAKMTGTSFTKAFGEEVKETVSTKAA